MADGSPDFSIEDLEKLDVIQPEPKSEPERKSEKGSGSTTRKKTATRKPSAASLRGRLSNLLTLVGTVLSGFDAYDGSVIIDNADALAEQLDLLAKENPKVKAALESALSAGAWSGVFGVLGVQILAPIAVHHRMLPEPINDQVAAVLNVPVKEKRVREEEVGSDESRDLDR